MPFPKTIPADQPIEPDGLIVVIIGPPDAGKSLTAQTARNPYTWAFDSGLYRAGFKKDAVQASGMTWAETNLETLTKEEWDEAGYQTVVLDTGGGCILKYRDHLVRTQPIMKKGGSLIPKAYGIIGEKWAELLYRFKYEWKTDLVIVDHIRETMVDEQVVERIAMLGQMTIAEVYKEADLIGRQRRIEENLPNGGVSVRRTITFSGNDRAFRKDPAQFGEMEIPDLRQIENRGWLGGLMDRLREDVVERQRESTSTDKMIEDIYALTEAQAEPNEDIAAAATEATNAFRAAKTPSSIVRPMIDRMRDSGYTYDQTTKMFLVAAPAVAEEPAVEEPPAVEEAPVAEEPPTIEEQPALEDAS